MYLNTTFFTAYDSEIGLIFVYMFMEFDSSLFLCVTVRLFHVSIQKCELCTRCIL